MDEFIEKGINDIKSTVKEKYGFDASTSALFFIYLSMMSLQVITADKELLDTAETLLKSRDAEKKE